MNMYLPFWENHCQITLVTIPPLILELISFFPLQVFLLLLLILYYIILICLLGFRYGHSEVNDYIPRVDEERNVIPRGAIPLKNVIMIVFIC